MKRKIILTACLSTLLLGFLGIAQSIRWYRLQTPSVVVSESASAVQDVTILKKEYPKEQFDADYDYYYSYKVQYVYSRGTFPFSCVKIDTISNAMDHHSR